TVTTTNSKVCSFWFRRQMFNTTQKLPMEMKTATGTAFGTVRFKSLILGGLLKFLFLILNFVFPKKKSKFGVCKSSAKCAESGRVIVGISLIIKKVHCKFTMAKCTESRTSTRRHVCRFSLICRVI